MTEVCNLACIHCPHPQFKESEHYGARFLNERLALKAVDEVREWGSQYIRFCAEGEPLIHPRIYDMLDYAVEKSGTFVTLTTNGTIMEDRRIEKLLKSGLNMIDVSIDALSPETYSTIRKGNLRAVMENVLRLVYMAKGTNTRVVVSFIEQPENRHEREGFEKFWTEVGAKVIVRRLHTAAGSVSKELVSGDRYPCLYPWERVVLAPDGWLTFCPQEWFKRSRVANYRTTTIKETWEGEFYQKLRQAHLENQCSGVCKNCPDWSQTKWPWQGKSYSDLVSALS